MYLFVFVTEISSQTITSPSLSPQAQIQQYVISSRVFAGHQIPPIQQFSESKSYITGLLVFPIIIAVLGILSIFIFQSILCVRFCYHALCPSEHRECYNIASASEPDYERRKTYHSRSIIWFFTFIILTLITNCFVFIGDSLLSVSGRQASDSIVQLSNLFYDINSNANSISYDLGNMSALISTQPCYTYWNTIPGLYNQLIEQCQVGQSSAQSLAGVVGSTGTNLYDLNNVLTKTYLFYKSISVYSQFAIVTVSALLLITAYFVKLKWLLTTAIVLSLLMVLLMTFVGSALMLVTVRIVCMMSFYMLILFLYPVI